jgi:hypothetical protein
VEKTVCTCDVVFATPVPIDATEHLYINVDS